MKNVLKSIISIVLVISMFICATVPAFAVGGEEYICDLRIIYADDYREAKEILKDSEFNDYELLDENLNESTGETGVWIAYKVTDDIEDAITDLAVMQMNGGYREGNYQEMIKQSYDEYVAMGEAYLTAIEYFAEGYDAGHFLSKSAYRQLNFYTSITDKSLGIEIPDFDGELLGDIFYDGIGEGELATMFLEGNSYALKNIRSLLAMGVSYNADGKTYLQKVSEEVKKLKSNPALYAKEDYELYASIISATIESFRNMIEELSAYEDELNYEDSELTDNEIKYLEYKSVAERLRSTDYLNGKSLYDFCLNYTVDKKDYSSLYPLVAALNEGQLAMTKVAHYHDVVRYSMTTCPEDIINEELDKLEEKYSEKPFNIYTGVDRTIFTGTFALTSEAYRADSYSEYTLSDAFFGNGNASTTVMEIGYGVVGFAFGVWGALRYIDELVDYKNHVIELTATYNTKISTAGDVIASQKFTVAGKSITAGDFVDDLVADHLGTDSTMYSSFADKVNALVNSVDDVGVELDPTGTLNKISEAVTKKQIEVDPLTITDFSLNAFTGAMFVLSAAMMLYSAVSLFMTFYSYYNPDYEDVPIALVDLIETIDGDRYIKYDVVYEAEPREKNIYSAGDLNAFEAQRWNALYYTKSYEAGKPLLAGEFSVSTTNNKPQANYTPIHRFGEVVCYDLNKYNFDYDDSIYLSVKQSKNNKSVVADVPAVVGSIFGAGFLFLAGGIGAVAGVGGILAAQGIMKKKKSKSDQPETLAENADNS